MTASERYGHGADDRRPFSGLGRCGMARRDNDVGLKEGENDPLPAA